MPRPTSTPRPYVKAGRLVVCLRDSRTGCRRTVYLGAAGTPEARREYARVLSEWEDGDRVVTPAASAIQYEAQRANTVSVAGVVLRYFRAVKARHCKADGSLTSHGQAIQAALRCLREQAGDHAASDFGPNAHRTVRDAMAGSGPFNRDVVDRDTRYIVAAIRWAVAEELVPPRTYEALRCLEPLKRGEMPGLRESKVVHPVSGEVVAATLPHLSAPLRGLVELMRLTRARRGELTGLRPVDIDTSGRVWRA